MARSLPFFLLATLLFACNNLEDANVPERKTFIRFFGSVTSYTSVVAERDADGGFILVGNVAPMSVEPLNDPRNFPGIVVIKTDAQGVKTWEKIYRHSNAQAIMPLSDGGYLVTGQGIELNPGSPESSEFVNTKFLLMKLSSTGDSVGGYKLDSTVNVQRGTGSVTLKVDFKAFSSVINNGEIETVGSYKVPGLQERTITMGFTPSFTPVWRKNLDLQSSDYVNTNFLGLSNGNLVWTSTAVPSDANQSKYMSVIAVQPNYASPANNALFGKGDETGGHEVRDMQPSATGYGAIGTFTNKSGARNVFFTKIDAIGNVFDTAYFDCGATDPALITVKNENRASQSLSQDDGNAIVYTKDSGFILACSMQQTPEKGNGGTDILLIKIDAFGKYSWEKLLGGSGNEVATSIRELSDGTLLIAGTSTISNISSMFIIRADANGDLKE